MYDFVDQPVTRLDEGGRFLVWSMRSWVGALGGTVCPASRIGPAFARHDMIVGLQPFHRMMLLLNRDALETFHFCALTCNRVSEHEALVISLIRAMRYSRPDEVCKLLARVADEAALPGLIEALSGVGRSLARAGLWPMPPRGPIDIRASGHRSA